MRIRHDGTRDKKRLRDLHYDMNNIITKYLLAVEYPNEDPVIPVVTKRSSFYEDYIMSLPINTHINPRIRDLLKERV